MQVPRYRTAYTAIRLAPVMVDMNLPLRETLAPGPLFFSLRASPALVTSLSLRLFLFFFSVPLSLTVVLCACSALQSSFLFISLCALSLPPSFPLRKFAMLHGEEQKSISRGENWVTERAWRDKKRCWMIRVWVFMYVRFIKHLATD